MANLFSSSIGRKLVMSISGLFLIMFLFVHLTVNSFLLLDPLFGTSEGEMFNAGVHFMGINPFIKIIEPLLFIGFIIHIVYSFILTKQNKRARGSAVYASGSKTKEVEWSSKNMVPLGAALLAFLIVHLANFWVKMKITHEVEGVATFSYFGVPTTGEDAYTLVHETFKIGWVVIVYVIGSLSLALHISHGFWSAFQTMGANNLKWIPRLQKISSIVAWFIGIGFSVIAIAQYLFFPL